MKFFVKVFASTILSLVALFFIVIGVFAMVTKQDFVVVMNQAFDFFKTLFASR